METFKTLLRSLLGTDQSLEKMEHELKGELTNARSKTREALESLRKMAQEMQWRIEQLEQHSREEGRHDVK